jgi:hypothetical protein
MREAEREEGMRVTERTREIRWTKDMNNRIRFSLLRFIFSLNEREFCFLTLFMFMEPATAK